MSNAIIASFPPTWKAPYPWNPKCLVFSCRVSGLVGCPSDEYTDKDGCVPIDASLVDIIIRLNQAGYTTQFCCSGLQEDHHGHEDSLSSGYISFTTDSFRKRSPKLPKGLRWDDNCIRVKLNVDQPTLRAVWEGLQHIVETL